MGSVYNNLDAYIREKRLQGVGQDISGMSDTKLVRHSNPEVQRIAEDYAGANAGVETPISPTERLSKIRDILYKRGAVNKALTLDVSLANAQQKSAADSQLAQRNQIETVNKVYDMALKASNLYKDPQKGIDVLNQYIPGSDGKYEKRNIIREGDLTSFNDPITGIRMKHLILDTNEGYKIPLTYRADDPLMKSIEDYPKVISKIVEYGQVTGTPAPEPTKRRWLREAKKTQSEAKVKGSTKTGVPLDVKARVDILKDEAKKLNSLLTTEDYVDKKASKEKPGFFDSSKPLKKYKLEEQKNKVEREISILSTLGGKRSGIYEIDGQRVLWDGTKEIVE